MSAGRGGGGVDDGSIAVDQAASDLLLPEVDALLDRLPPGESQAAFTALRRDIESRAVAAERQGALEQVLRLGIETGRFERVHGRAADTLARALYGRTPEGRAAAEQADAVSAGLAAFTGSVLHAVRVSADGPGGYRFAVETDRGQALVRMDRAGVRVDSVETG